MAIVVDAFFQIYDQQMRIVKCIINNRWLMAIFHHCSVPAPILCALRYHVTVTCKWQAGSSIIHFTMRICWFIYWKNASTTIAMNSYQDDLSDDSYSSMPPLEPITSDSEKYVDLLFIGVPLMLINFGSLYHTPETGPRHSAKVDVMHGWPPRRRLTFSY